MAMFKVILILLGLINNSSGFVEKRQTICVDSWATMANPCKQNPGNAIYLPHPVDNTKFIQCDMIGRMYIVQCPRGETYDTTTSSCVTASTTPTAQPTTTHRPVTTPPPTPPPTTNPTTSAGITQPQNPCSNANIAKGKIYFEYPNDPRKFIECDMLGNAMVLPCASGLVWNQKRLSCVYNIKPGAVLTTSIIPAVTTTMAFVGTTKNPCVGGVTNTDQLFHPHPNPHKFYQCDLWGELFVNDCPPNLIWNDATKTCSSAYMAVIPVG